MNNLIVYFGAFYIFIGIVFLFVPLIYLELGRPKDLIKSFFNLLIGFILIINNKIIAESFFEILFLLTLLVVLYVIEIFSSRWNQLTDKEKNKLITFSEFKNSFSKIIEAINLGLRDFKKLLDFLNFDRNNENKKTKKWVRNDKNDNIKI